MNNPNMYFKSTKTTFAILDVIKNIAKSFPSMSRRITRVLEIEVKANKSTIGDMSQLIKKEYPILKPKGMLGKEMLKVVIPLRNGKNYRGDTNIVVLFAGSVKNLLKTILSRYQKVVRITSRIFNHFVAIAIAENGNTVQDYFSIYQDEEVAE